MQGLEEDNLVLWRPSTAFDDTQTGEFVAFINKNLKENLTDYHTLYRWSVTNHGLFWEQLWKWSLPLHSASYSSILAWNDAIINTMTVERHSLSAMHAALPIDVPIWFPGAKLNYAENLLCRADENAVAMYSVDEGGDRVDTITFKTLRCRVAQLAAALHRAGVSVGDRVVGYVPNCALAAQAMLATAAIGAIWSSASPDFGVSGVLDRFSQITPKILFSVAAVKYNNKRHDHLDKLSALVQGLPHLERVVLLPHLIEDEHHDTRPQVNAIFKSCWLDEFLCGLSESEPEYYEQLPFNHQLVILYSSGTTGIPKCIVHSAGGTLLKHLEEHRLQVHLSPEDIVMYYTTTGWMMWNWLLSVMACGTAIVLYDGSPLIPDDALSWRLIDKLKITVFGTSAKLLNILEQRRSRPSLPDSGYSLKSLRCILSTGSPLSGRSFEYVYRCVKSDLLLGSITGGTDIIACFAGCTPTLPVRRGEIQVPMLGMAIECWSENGVALRHKDGELVCTKPFPSQPICFWNDFSGVRYRASYFERFVKQGIWAHGDYCRFNDGIAPSLTMLGRCDGTLNPGGVRFGSAEIYNILEDVDEIVDSLCVGQYSPQSFDERVILFVRMAPGHEFHLDLVDKLKALIREKLSPRHVPAVVLPCLDIPYTQSNKKVELAVRYIIEKKPVLNRSALRNPEALEHFKDLPDLINF